MDELNAAWSYADQPHEDYLFLRPVEMRLSRRMQYEGKKRKKSGLEQAAFSHRVLQYL